MEQYCVLEPHEETFSDELKGQSKLLYDVLVQLVHGRAYAILKLVPAGHGMTAWARIFAEYELPDQIPRQMSILSGLLDPKWGKDVPEL